MALLCLLSHTWPSTYKFYRNSKHILFFPQALLGTYRCTEVPGEFVWQPGVLTQAVTNGYWVLLEDIDYAPMEVVSVLLPLLETRCLSVPGHGDNITAAPGFHLFATQRYCALELISWLFVRYTYYWVNFKYHFYLDSL